MILTRHIIIVFAVIGIALFAVALYFLFIYEGGEHVAPENQNVRFNEEVEDYRVVFDSEADDKKAYREALIAKLGMEANDTPLDTNEPEDVPHMDDGSEVPPDENGLPIGDGKVATSPQKGSIFSCQKVFESTGMLKEGEWIRNGYWYPNEKVTVEGEVSWQGDVSISIAEGARLITSNGLPNHITGIFPISTDDDAYQYDRNSNSISSQGMVIQIPKDPTIALAPSCLPLGPIGIGLSGAFIFNGLDDYGDDAPAHEIQDSCGGHPESTGTYHYHNESSCLRDGVYEGAGSTLLGYALDGFGIYSSIEHGVPLTNDDLDACHGHEHQIPWDGVMVSLYHYHMTNEYPYTLGCFMGEPVDVAPISGQFPLGSRPIPPPSPLPEYQ